VVERIVDDVVDRRLVLLVRFDHLRPVAPAEDVILSSVPFIEGSGVGAVQIPHPIGEIRQGGLDQKVVVVAHQAADVGAPAVAALDAAQNVEEDDPVSVVQHDRGMVVAPDADVVVGAGGQVTMWSSHFPNVARSPPANRRGDNFGAGPTRSRHVPGTGPGTIEPGPTGRGRPG
jgi:hypothetical protein